ncbi:MAG: hypothetical protein R3Y35_12015 [Clostridia bacterium]
MKKKILALSLALCLLTTTLFSVPIITKVLAAETTTGGNADESTEGVSVSKEVTYTIDNTSGDDVYSYTLNLETFTTGTITQTTEVVTPADIALVLDQSTSMIWPASQAEDNGLDDGNIGIVDGSYTYTSATTDSNGNVTTAGSLSFTQYDTVSVTPLYGIWTASNTERTAYDLTVSTNNNTVIIGGVTYTFGDTYNLNPALWEGEYADEYIAVFGYLYSQSRQSDVIEAVVDFIAQLEEDNTGHRVSIVTYNTGVDETIALTDDYEAVIKEVLSWVNAVNVAGDSTDGLASNKTDADSDDNTEDNSSAAGVTSFNLKHSTQICFGVESAESILATAKATDADLYTDTGRTQLCVIFTDGIPTNDDDSTYSNVNRTVQSASDMKNAGVTVFTIGMLNGVYEQTEDTNYDNTYTVSTYDYGDRYANGNSYITDGDTFISAFLDVVSSNYNVSSWICDDFPNSSSLYDVSSTSTAYEIDTNTTKNTDADGNYTQYYYPIDTETTTNIADTLSGIFDTVAGAMTGSATITLDATTQVRDIMTNDFSISEGASNLTVSLVYATGLNDEVDTELYNEYDSEWYTWSETPVVLYNETDGITTGWEELTVTMGTVTVNTAARDDDGNIIYDEDGNPTYTGDTYDTEQVIVEGFNYNDYYVTGEARYFDETDETETSNAPAFYGGKLVISFDIEPNDGTIDLTGTEVEDENYYTFGGNAIETNHVTSGVYILEDGEYTMLEDFPLPIADIPINLVLEATDQTIYLGNSVSVVDLLQVDGHTIMGVANANVDIEFSIYADLDGNGEVDTENTDPLLTVTILAGESIYDATEDLFDTESLITPTATTSYVITTVVTPTTGGSVEEVYEATDPFNVYVLYPTIETNDIWVDYATPVNLREDNVLQVADDSVQAFDTIRVTWETAGEDIPQPNNDVPPTVTFGFTSRRGIEYTAAEFEEYGVREDKEFQITSMTTTSSDGYNNVTYYEMGDYDVESIDENDFSVNINRFDLTIEKTVEADVYDIYPQSFIFDVSYTGSEFVTQEAIATGPNGFAIFATDSTNNTKFYVDTTDYETYSATGSYPIYSNVDLTKDLVYNETYGYYEATELFVNAGGTLNDSDSDYYIDMENSTIYADGKAYTVTYSGYETVEINDIEKNIEVVIDPEMDNVEVVEWWSGDTRYYTFSTTVTDLYCGIEMKVTEETDWSWRYEPGFTTSTTSQYAQYYSNTTADTFMNLNYIESEYSYEDLADEENGYVRTTVNAYETEEFSYFIVNIVSPYGDDDDAEVRTVYIQVYNSALDGYDLDELASSFADIDAYFDANPTLKKQVIYDATAIMTVNSDGTITQTTTEEIDSYKIISYDEVHNGEGALGDVNGLDTGYDKYLTEYTFNSISQVTVSDDAKTATILVYNSEDYLNKNDSDKYADWTRITYRLYLGSSLYHASDVEYIENGAQYNNYISYMNYESQTVLVLFDDEQYVEHIDFEDDILLYSKAYYYDESGNKVNEVLFEADGTTLAEATYYQIAYTPVLTTDEEYVYDTDGNLVYTETEIYAFQVLDVSEAVAAVEFDSIDVSLDVFNTLTNEYWLDDNSLVENYYNPIEYDTVEVD